MGREIHKMTVLEAKNLSSSKRIPRPSFGLVLVLLTLVSPWQAYAQKATWPFCIEALCLGMPAKAAFAVLANDGYVWRREALQLADNSATYLRENSPDKSWSVISYQLTYPVEPSFSVVWKINRNVRYGMQVGLNTFEQALREKYGPPTFTAERDFQNLSWYGYFYTLDGLPSPDQNKCYRIHRFSTANVVEQLLPAQCHRQLYIQMRSTNGLVDEVWFNLLDVDVGSRNASAWATDQATKRQQIEQRNKQSGPKPKL